MRKLRKIMAALAFALAVLALPFAKAAPASSPLKMEICAVWSTSNNGAGVRTGFPECRRYVVMPAGTPLKGFNMDTITGPEQLRNTVRVTLQYDDAKRVRGYMGEASYAINFVTRVPVEGRGLQVAGSASYSGLFPVEGPFKLFYEHEGMSVRINRD